ncbi:MULTISPECIES: hypothetical protein [unclassified Streptomyces]|uniref:hypothetical protein n=1 Tax=unclassified Streptomyces TaxID=2593676 RepID=UPI0037FFEDFE
MNHRYVSAVVALTSSAAFLAATCGSSAASPNVVASAKALSITAGPVTASVASSQGSAPDGSADAGRSTPRVPGAPSAADAQARTMGATAWQPCHLPAGYKHFFELESAKNVQGSTVVRVTPETCSVNTKNDEDVVYTPIGAARSFAFASGASVKVFTDINTTTVKSVAPKWLVSHELTNSPHFYYRVNDRSEITAMEEIYHP